VRKHRSEFAKVEKSTPLRKEHLLCRMQAELQEAAAAVRATQGETVASEFARLFDQRFSAFEEVQSRLNVKLTERHEAQETRLLVRAFMHDTVYKRQR